ncbi:MAG TPA: protein kinase [Gemmataceae bacterium]|nr:protein kinase [Gemmataceae bacterium]
MDHEAPTRRPDSEAATPAPAPSADATRSAPGPDAAGRTPPEVVPAELQDHPRYRVLGLLGQGGMGAVYKAEHRHMGRVVALKVINPGLVGSEAAVQRFRQEVQTAARLTHPNIVTAYDADHAGGLHFLVMEFLDGESLDEYLRRKNVLPVAEACDYARQAALGLQHAHELGMVHRDVKPHNLMRTPDGRVKILDFGLARLARAAEAPADPAAPAPSAQLTAVGAVMGTADYMAPEQAGDARSADIRADIYSLGCTLYQLLAGRVPFPGGSALDKLLLHAAETPADLTRLRPDIPAGLAAVVRKMTAKDPASRYQTPAEVAAALAPFAAPPRTARRLAVAVVVGVAALLAVVALCLWLAKPSWFGAGGSQQAQAPPQPTTPKPIVNPPKQPRPPRVERVPVKYREAIKKGLAYLARTQQPDGRWEADSGQYPTSMTALAGMALLMEGSTDGDGDYADSLRKAVDWFLKESQPNGILGNPNNNSEKDRYTFGHGYAMLFLATVYGQEEDDDRRRKLERLLTKAVEFTSEAQTKNGGWGYVRAADGGNFDEGATTIVQLQGLRAARNAGIVVPKKLIDIDYLRKCTAPDDGVIYTLSGGGGGAGRPALTAAALACMYTTGDADSESARKWLQFCQRTLPVEKPDPKLGHDEYIQYYYAQALYILGDDGYAKLFPSSKPTEQLGWSKYRQATFDDLLSRQSADGGWRTGSIGPVYSTACYLTILQLDNEVLQIYRR